MRGCPKDQATGTTSQGEALYTQTRPLHPPSLLLLTTGEKKNGPEAFYGKVLRGEKEKKERVRVL